MVQVQAWICLASTRHVASSGAAANKFSEVRRKALRQGDVGRWAALSRRALSGPMYSPLWCTNSSGVTFRPNSAAEARAGASQERATLVQEPALAWSHPGISISQDAAGHPRGSLDIRALGDVDKLLPSGQAILGLIGPSHVLQLVR